MTLDELTKLEAAMSRPPWSVKDYGGYWRVKADGDTCFDDGSASGEYYEQCSPDDRDGLVALRNAAPALIAAARERDELAVLLRKHAAIPCGDCNGTGCYMGPADKDEPCRSCEGSGSTLPDDVAAVLARLEGEKK